jgi:hypothetical protein
LAYVLPEYGILMTQRVAVVSVLYYACDIVNVVGFNKRTF